MASIQTAIQLADRVSGPMLQIMNSVNRTITAFEEMQRASAVPVDTGWVDGTRQEINEAAASVTLLQEEIEKVAKETAAPVIEPKISMPDPLPYPATGPSYNIPENLPAPKIPQPDPVTVPIVWETSGNLEVFTNSGVERFQQEIQAASASLDSMTASQSNVIRMAQRMEIPPGMMNDLVGMNARIRTIQTSIKNLEANPIDDLGADTVNNQLEQLRGQLAQAASAQNQLTEAMGRMDISAANAAYNQMNSVVSQAERGIRDNTGAQKEFNQEVGKGTDAANGLLRTIARYAAAFAGAAGVKKALDLSDTLTSTTARLNMMNDGLQTTEDLQNMIFLSAQNSRGAYQETADMVARLGMMAGDAFGSNAETIAFAEQLNKQFVIAGTDATGVSAAMLQLTQAMGSGVLRGEEFNSILEQAPNIVQTIADYMGVPKGELKDMASEGKITADIVKNALFAATDETNAKFESMPVTFSQVGESIKNQALKAFEPVLQRIGEITQSADFQTMTTEIVNALVVLSEAALDAFELFSAAGEWIIENWSSISPVIFGVALAIAAYTGFMIIHNTVQAISNGLAAIAAARAALETGATLTKAAAIKTATGAQVGMNAALLASPVTWIIIGIIALVAVIYKWVQSVGGLKIAWLIVCNAVLTAWDWLKIGFFTGIYWIMDKFNQFQLMFKTVSTNVQNFIGDMKAGALQILQDMVNGAIDIINNFIDLLNNIPGVSIESISHVTFGAEYAAANEAEKAVRNQELADYKAEIEQKMSERDKQLDDMKADARMSTRARVVQIEQEKLALELEKMEDSTPQPQDPYTPEIAADTGAMKDSMEISQEDLKYLREIADRESINRFTTAEIKVDMNNTNQLSSNMDIDGFINHFGEQMEETLASVAVAYSG